MTLTRWVACTNVPSIETDRACFYSQQASMDRWTDSKTNSIQDFLPWVPTVHCNGLYVTQILREKIGPSGLHLWLYICFVSTTALSNRNILSRREQSRRESVSRLASGHGGKLRLQSEHHEWQSGRWWGRAGGARCYTVSDSRRHHCRGKPFLNFSSGWMRHRRLYRPSGPEAVGLLRIPILFFGYQICDQQNWAAKQKWVWLELVPLYCCD